jgi:cytoskeletal protein RodZ
MSEMNSLTRHVEKLGESLDFWNRWMVWALILVAIAAIWVVVTTRFTILRSKELSVAQGVLDTAKGTKLSLELKEKDQQIANVKSDSDKANAKAEGFRLDIARANESAANAEAQVAIATAEAAKASAAQKQVEITLAAQQERAARAESELLELQLRTKGREVTEQQASLFRENANSKPKGFVSITAMNDSTEAIAYAQQLSSLINQNGWQSQISRSVLVGDVGLGVTVVIKSTLPLQTDASGHTLVPFDSPVFYGAVLAKALQSAGILVTIFVDGSMASNGVELLVGRKP